MQLDPPIRVMTPLGLGWAHVLDGDPVEWCVFLDVSGEVWWFRNHLIRAPRSTTAAVQSLSSIEAGPEWAPHIARYRAQGWLSGPAVSCRAVSYGGTDRRALSVPPSEMEPTSGFEPETC